MSSSVKPPKFKYRDVSLNYINHFKINAVLVPSGTCTNLSWIKMLSSVLWGN